MSEIEYVFSPQEKAKLEPLLKYLDPERIVGLKEMVINSPQEIGVENMAGEWKFIEAPELTKQVLMEIVQMLAELAKESFNLANPILSLRLPGGHRAQVVGGVQNTKGFSMCIRLHQKREFTLNDFDIPDSDRHAIIEAVKNQKTILISGGTGSGKTSFANCIIKFIPKSERLVTIEDVRELEVPHHNWCSFTFANSGKGDGAKASDILNACLRMRPDRILLGEIRQENAFVFCSAINTGHAGSMSTIHANDPKSALDAVINRIMLNGDVSETAMEVLRRQLVNDIYGVVQLNRVKGGVEGYFEVLDPDRARREREEAEDRTRNNAEAAALEAELAKEREAAAQARMERHEENS